MRTAYKSFRDVNDNSIPECKIDQGDKVKVIGLIENDNLLWQQLNRVILPIERYDGRRWVRYGSFIWSGAIAVKPDVRYSILTDRLFLFSGSYRMLDFEYEIGPRVGGLYYKTGAFNLKFSRS